MSEIVLPRGTDSAHVSSSTRVTLSTCMNRHPQVVHIVIWCPQATPSRTNSHLLTPSTTVNNVFGMVTWVTGQCPLIGLRPSYPHGQMDDPRPECEQDHNAPDRSTAEYRVCTNL